MSQLAVQTPAAAEPLALVEVSCCICETDDAEPVAVGEDTDSPTSCSEARTKSRAGFEPEQRRAIL